MPDPYVHWRWGDGQSDRPSCDVIASPSAPLGCYMLARHCSTCWHDMGYEWNKCGICYALLTSRKRKDFLCTCQGYAWKHMQDASASFDWQSLQRTHVCTKMNTYRYTTMLYEFIRAGRHVENTDLYTYTQTHTYIHTYTHLHTYRYIHIHTFCTCALVDYV